MYREPVLLFAILLWIWLPAGHAQLLFEQSTLLEKKEGLPTNAIGPVNQDERGFIWIGTQEGLCRFDGSHFRIYKNDPDDSTSLFDNAIHAVQPYRGEIWVATSMGISVFNPQTERFRHFQLDGHGVVRPVRRAPRRQVGILYLDPRGELWLGTTFLGVVKYRPESDDFQYYTLNDSAALNRFARGNDGALRILSITASNANDSIIYAGTPVGLQEINRITGRVKWLHFPMSSPDEEIGANAFRRLYSHDDGRLFCGSWRSGIHIYNPVDGAFLPLQVRPGPGSEILNYGTQGFLRKNAAEIWVTTGHGLALYDTQKREVTFWRKNNIPEGRFYGITFIDEAQRVWFPAFNGLHIFDPRLQQFTVHNYENLHAPGWSFTYYLLPVPESDELLIVPRGETGIYHFNLKTRDWTRIVPKVPGMQLPEVWGARGLALAPDGTFTISTENGLFSYDAGRRKLSLLPFQPDFSFIHCDDVRWDQKGQLWLSAETYGLLCWNPKSNSVRTFQQELMPPGTPPANLVVRDIFEDSRGQMWIRREDGLGVYLPLRDTVLNFLYSKNPANTFTDLNGFVEDRFGRIWVSDKDGWVGYAESARPEAGLVKKINLRAAYGLGEIYGLAADGNGDIWGYTQKDLLQIRAEDHSVSIFSFDYGAMAPEFYNLVYLPTGEFVLGGRNQIVFFNPKTLRRNTELPQPYVESIRVQGKPLPAIPEVDGKPGLRLRYWENFFSVDFSAKAYTLGNKCRFRYRLRDFEDWQEAGERRHANYTNVPGGEYVFEVQVANNEGVWSDTVLEMPVWVDTAWWATWWFRILAMLALLSAGYALYRYRVLQIRRQERVRTEFEKKLANVEMSALLAQMNPHFLFNSLNSIDSYIIRNESKKASEYLNNFARLIRLILNNSRSNYINLKDELEALELYLQMESLRFRDKFQYEIIVDGTLDVASINIPPMLIQPYIENAIWHGLMYKEAGPGKVVLRVEHKNDCLVITVQDNGVGRAKAMELGARHARKKTQSVGMKITEDRIEIINKLYDANTKVEIFDLYDDAGVPAGTKVVLTVPI